MTKERVCVNGKSMSRRTLFTALPLAAASMTLPAVASAHNPGPMVSPYHEWLDARREWRELAELPGNGNYDHPKSVAAQARETWAEQAMLAITPASLEGIGALAALAWSDVGPGTTDPEEYERFAQSFDCQIVIAIWKACTGKEGYPET